ncbi:MAG: alpha/beta hydrolase [Williamsia sp.]|nr:alpha/beta hydrolase [Williamsia sp.]
MVSCTKEDNIVADDPYDRIQPSGPKPAWGPTINPQMQTVIETLDGPSPVALYTLTPQQARQQPTAADAVKKVMQKFAIPMPPMNVDTTGKDIAVQDGTIHLRIYTPKTGKSSYPLIVYYHGGGWVIATIDTYDASAQALAEQVDAVVVSVEYRKAPESKFPTAHKDSYAAYKWAVQNAASIKADAAKVATAGESAGGNLAVAVAMMARDSSFAVPKHILSVYPIADYDFNTPSYNQYAEAHPLSKPLMQWFFMYYLSNSSEGSNPLISLVNANLAGLPPATIINAEIDPLESEGGQLAARLDAAKVPVVRQVYTGVTHEFFGMATVVREAKDAQAFAAQRLKQALGN